jgi:hypothetical protein
MSPDDAPTPICHIKPRANALNRYGKCSDRMYSQVDAGSFGNKKVNLNLINTSDLNLGLMVLFERSPSSSHATLTPFAAQADHDSC